MCIRDRPGSGCRARATLHSRGRLPEADRTDVGGLMSCPVSTPGRSGRFSVGLGEDGLEGPVLGGVVAEVVVPAAPDDVCPGSSEDADCVGVVVAAGDGSVV